MATIDVHIDAERDLTVFTVTGELAADEAWEAASEYYSGNPTRLLLWDMTCGSMGRISADHLRRHAAGVRKLAHNRPKGKSAFVGDLVMAGVGRMYEAFAELQDLPYEYKAFRTVPEAMQWLGVTGPAADNARKAP